MGRGRGLGGWLLVVSEIVGENKRRYHITIKEP
jgi:hypothetical protein